MDFFSNELVGIINDITGRGRKDAIPEAEIEDVKVASFDRADDEKLRNRRYNIKIIMGSGHEYYLKNYSKIAVSPSAPGPNADHQIYFIGDNIQIYDTASLFSPEEKNALPLKLRGTMTRLIAEELGARLRDELYAEHSLKHQTIDLRSSAEGLKKEMLQTVRRSVEELGEELLFEKDEFGHVMAQSISELGFGVPELTSAYKCTVSMIATSVSKGAPGKERVPVLQISDVGDKRASIIERISADYNFSFRRINDIAYVWIKKDHSEPLLSDHRAYVCPAAGDYNSMILEFCRNREKVEKEHRSWVRYGKREFFMPELLWSRARQSMLVDRERHPDRSFRYSRTNRELTRHFVKKLQIEKIAEHHPAATITTDIMGRPETERAIVIRIGNMDEKEYLRAKKQLEGSDRLVSSYDTVSHVLSIADQKQIGRDERPAFENANTWQEPDYRAVIKQERAEAEIELKYKSATFALSNNRKRSTAREEASCRHEYARLMDVYLDERAITPYERKQAREELHTDKVREHIKERASTERVLNDRHHGGER